MDKVVIELPKMYGDHHVVEVRRLLLEAPGVQGVYASSSFRLVEIEFDPELTSASDLTGKLEEAGYLGEWAFSTEKGAGSQPEFFRHAAVYENTRQVVSFAQSVQTGGKPLWPCPGIGVIQVEE